MSWDDGVEDVWAIARERNGLRVQLKRSEAQNRKLAAEIRRLRTILAGYTDQTKPKPDDLKGGQSRSRASAYQQ